MGFHMAAAMRDAELRGEQRGYRIGEQQGRQESKKQIAKNLLEEGIDINLVSKATGLSVSEIVDSRSCYEAAGAPE